MKIIKTNHQKFWKEWVKNIDREMKKMEEELKKYRLRYGGYLTF